jgi:hypothetical protein
MLNSDLIDLLQILNKNKTRYIIVGAHAVIQYTEPRYTKDLDVWVDPTSENSKKVWKSLVEFGAPLDQVSITDFQNEDNMFQIGMDPNRIDIIMGLENLVFDESWQKSEFFEFESIRVKVLNISDLIKSKKDTGRIQDQLDIEKLEKAKILYKTSKPAIK